MFSPISIGNYILKSVVGQSEENDGDADDHEREVPAETDDSGSDSDSGTSTDPPDLRIFPKPTSEGEDARRPLVEPEITASDMASEEASLKKDEFAARLAALPEAKMTEDDSVTTTCTYMIIEDNGDAGLKDTGFNVPQESFAPECTRGDTNKTGDIQLDSALGEEFMQHQGGGSENLLQVEDASRHLEADGDFEIPSDSNSDSSLSTTSGESVSTVRENTEMESVEQNNFEEDESQKGDTWAEQEEHVYIAPDLEFPFYKTSVEIEQTINLKDVLENMEKDKMTETPQPEESKYIPKPISDEELENALRILRSGKPPPTRSWYSLDNISSSRPNRAFALYYDRVDQRRERRNSEGDEIELSSPTSESIIFSLTGSVTANIAKDDTEKERDIPAPREPSHIESARSNQELFGEKIPTHLKNKEDRDESQLNQGTYVNEYYTMPNKSLDGPSSFEPDSYSNLRTGFFAAPDENSCFSVTEPILDTNVIAMPFKTFPSKEETNPPRKPETTPETFQFVAPYETSLESPSNVIPLLPVDAYPALNPQNTDASISDLPLPSELPPVKPQESSRTVPLDGHLSFEPALRSDLCTEVPVLSNENSQLFAPDPILDTNVIATPHETVPQSSQESTHKLLPTKETNPSMNPVTTPDTFQFVAPYETSPESPSNMTSSLPVGTYPALHSQNTETAIFDLPLPPAPEVPEDLPPVKIPESSQTAHLEPGSPTSTESFPAPPPTPPPLALIPYPEIPTAEPRESNPDTPVEMTPPSPTQFCSTPPTSDSLDSSFEWPMPPSPETTESFTKSSFQISELEMPVEMSPTPPAESHSSLLREHVSPPIPYAGPPVVQDGDTAIASAGQQDAIQEMLPESYMEAPSEPIPEYDTEAALPPISEALSALVSTEPPERNSKIPFDSSQDTRLERNHYPVSDTEPVQGSTPLHDIPQASETKHISASLEVKPELNLNSLQEPYSNMTPEPFPENKEAFLTVSEAASTSVFAKHPPQSSELPSDSYVQPQPEQIVDLSPGWSIPQPPENYIPKYPTSTKSDYRPKRVTFADLPPPAEDDLTYPKSHEISNDVSEYQSMPTSSQSEISPESQISVQEHPEQHPPSHQACSNDNKPGTDAFPQRIKQNGQHPGVLPKRQTELSSSLPKKQKCPPVPPKPSHIKTNVEIPARFPTTKKGNSERNLTPLKPEKHGREETLPVFPEPYISAQVKHPAVYTMPSLGSPTSTQVQQRIPVFSKVEKETVLLELANSIPKPKIPPKVPPKPRCRIKQQVDEPVFVSTEVAEIKRFVDISQLGEGPLRDKPQDAFLSPVTANQEREEEQPSSDETITEDDVGIIQAGISVYREETEVFTSTAGMPAPRRRESLQISDTGDASYINRDAETLQSKSEDYAQDGFESVEPVQRSLSTEVVRINARLSLHRLESGQQITETVILVHEQDTEVIHPKSPSSEEEGRFVSIDEENEDWDSSMNDVFSTDNTYGLPFTFPETRETITEETVPIDTPFVRAVESPELSSADEFMTEADMAMMKMAAAINGGHLKEISSSSPSSSEVSSGSEASDDSSSESAEEHTYIVTESGDEEPEEAYDSDECGVALVPTSLPQVIEEGEEELENTEESSDDKEDDRGNREDVRIDEPREDQEKENKQLPTESEVPPKIDSKTNIDREVVRSPEVDRKYLEDFSNNQIPKVVPVELERYPKYINYDRPMYATEPPTNDQHETWGTDNALSELPSSYTKTTTSYYAKDEHLTSEEQHASASYDSDESESEDDYNEKTMEFSSEHSDEPEWEPPPPSPGARVFVLTSNVQYPIKLEPSRELVNRVSSEPQGNRRADGGQDTESRNYDTERIGNGTEVDINHEFGNYADHNERRNCKDEPEKYFRPISEAAPTETKTVQEHARPIPQYAKEDPVDAQISIIESAPERPSGKTRPRDVQTVTVTYTVIHTKPTAPSSETARESYSEVKRKTRGTEDSSSKEDNQQTKHEEISDVNDVTGATIAADCKIPDDASELYYSPYHSPEPSEYTQSGRAKIRGDNLAHKDDSENKENEQHSDVTIQLTNAKKSEMLSSGAPHIDHRTHEEGNKRTQHVTGQSEECGTFEASHQVPDIPETGDSTSIEGQSGITSDDGVQYNSKSIPVNDVGPYLDSHVGKAKETRPESVNTTVKKIELRPELSVFEVSSKEQTSPKRRPANTGAPPPVGSPEESGAYKYSSWYEEPSEDAPVMAIALVKSDNRLLNEYAQKQETAKNAEPKPKPKLFPVIVNTKRGTSENGEEGEYKFTSWYEESTEEARDANLDVITVSSIAADEKTSPKKGTPLSPDVPPGTYKYQAWYEEAAEEPTETFFVISAPTVSKEGSKYKSSNAPTSPTKGRREYRYKAWDDGESSEKPPDNAYFVVSAPSTNEEKRSIKDPDERRKEEQYMRSVWYEDTEPPTEESFATFVVSKPYEEKLRLPDGLARPSVKSNGEDLYFPRETDQGDRKLSAGGSASGTSSRSSRTSGSQADVSATSGEAMMRTWSDDSEPEKTKSDVFYGGQAPSAFAPLGVEVASQLPPQPKPRKAKHSAPSSSDEEQQPQRQPRRPGRSDAKGQVNTTTGDTGMNLSPRAEYALASSSWRQIPVDAPTRESVIWDSGDDRSTKSRKSNRYSVSDQSRQEIETMLDSLVPNEDVFDKPRSFGSEPGPQPRPQRLEERRVQSQWSDQGSGSVSALSRDQSRPSDFVADSFQDGRFQPASEQMNPVPRGNESADIPSGRLTQKRHLESQVRQQVVPDGPPGSRYEYRLAAASWENLPPKDGSSKRSKMDKWETSPDTGEKRMNFTKTMVARHTYQPERAPLSTERANVPLRHPRGNGIVVTADVHAPYVDPPVPDDPRLAVKVLSASASTAELAPPPPKDLGTPRKAHSTLELSYRSGDRPDSRIVIPDAEADVPRPRRRPPGKIKEARPPSPGLKPKRPNSPVSISTYSSTQSLPARILPRLPQENEIERLKHHIAELGKQIEIKNAELRKIHARNPSVRHHIPMRGPRGELISPDGRVLSSPEKPNKAELARYKRFFEKLPEAHFRRLMHEMLEYKHTVKETEEEIRRLINQCTGLRRRLHRLAQPNK